MRARWTYQTTGLVDSSPAVVHGLVFVGSTDEHLPSPLAVATEPEVDTHGH